MRVPVGSALLTMLGVVASACGDSGDSGCPRVRTPEPSAVQAVLLEPAGEAFRLTAPDTFRVRFEASTGAVLVEVIREWAPIGADRFYNLARNRFFDGNRFFRVIPGAIVQFGVHGVPTVQAAWNEQPIPDDSVRTSNLRGTLTFATAGPNTRTTQLFINYGDNTFLDTQGFAPIGRVIEGMGPLLQLYSEYGEMRALGGPGVDYACMLTGGNAYLDREFERLDSIVHASVIE